MNSGQIDLWQFSLDRGGALAGALALLDTDEHAQFRLFDCPKLSAAFAFRRSARRIILSTYLNVEPNEVAFTAGPFGKPRVDGVHFNASHSSDHGCLAISRTSPVGVDIERLREVDFKLLAAHALSSAERHELQAVPPGNHAEQIFRHWTGKEAVMKGVGRGLELNNLPLIRLPPSASHSEWQPIRLAGRMRKHGDWFVCRPEPPVGYFIALASEFEAPVTRRDSDELLARYNI